LDQEINSLAHFAPPKWLHIFKTPAHNIYPICSILFAVMCLLVIKKPSLQTFLVQGIIGCRGLGVKL